MWGGLFSLPLPSLPPLVFGALDLPFGALFALYFWRWNSAVPANKAFLCLLATGLGVASVAAHGPRALLEDPVRTSGALIPATNAFMRTYFIADLAGMLLRAGHTKPRGDMIAHHLLCLAAYTTTADHLAMAFVASAEIISVWEFVLPRASRATHLRMRMLSIVPVRLGIWLTLLAMLRCPRLARVDFFFCVAVPAAMLPLDVFWFRACRARLQLSR